jgi:hypothetical protein
MISDDDLILYHYRDGLDPAERARIAAALTANPELVQRLHQLVARLDAVAAATPDVPVPAETMQRWQAALDQAAAGQTTRAPETAPAIPTTQKRFIPIPWLAVAATVVIAIAAVFQFRPDPAQPPPQTTNVTTPSEAGTAYSRGLKSHLASTERQLASLESATPEERARLIETIIEQNRIYAQAADRAGEPQLARVLRAFSPVLESLQHGEADPADSLDQLAFELRVMQGRLGAAPASATQSTRL